MLFLGATLANCAPPTEDIAMPNSDSRRPLDSGSDSTPVAVPSPGGRTPPPSPSVDSPAAAQGRRTLSTAFVRVGPDGHLTVGLGDGSVLVLRDVVMRATDYCGTLVTGTADSRKFCGDYADVASASPGGGPATDR